MLAPKPPSNPNEGGFAFDHIVFGFPQLKNIFHSIQKIIQEIVSDLLSYMKL